MRLEDVNDRAVFVGGLHPRVQCVRHPVVVLRVREGDLRRLHRGCDPVIGLHRLHRVIVAPLEPLARGTEAVQPDLDPSRIQISLHLDC